MCDWVESKCGNIGGMEEMELIEEAKKRCTRVMERVERLDTSKITASCKGTLLKLASSELNFLSSTHLHQSLPLSVNIGHLEAVVHILEQPFITGVSRVCKPFPLSPTIGNGEKSDCGGAKGVYLDIVCTLNRNPVWFIVSDRNPKYVSWDECSGNKGLRTRIQQVLDAARSSLTLKPSSVILFFSNGLDQCVCEKLQGEFGAYECAVEFPDCSFDFLEEPESEWINVLARSYRGACILEIKVDHVSPSVLVYDVKDSPPDAVGTRIPEKHIDISLGASFSSLISGMKFCCLHAEGVETLLGQDDLINFDTTALIAVVSGISNGGTEKLLAAPETEMRLRFKGNYKFVIAQVLSEIQNPIHVELSGLTSGKRGIICETVHSEFKELVSMCGGPYEKLRADQLLKCLMVVPDSPSARMMGLPTTRKLALKNKVVFGTGDYWHAPTLTANMAFVRAISQTGMSLFTIEHRPRALTGN